jgi:hypothetical protein
MLELDVEDNKIELTNREIEKIINRFEKCIKVEYAYRTNVIDERDRHTLLVDVEIKGGD